MITESQDVTLYYYYYFTVIYETNLYIRRPEYT